MKIGIYDPYLDTLGGGEKYMLTIASAISNSHDVYVFWDQETILEAAQERFALSLKKVRCTKNIFSSQSSIITRMLQTSTYDIIFFLSDGSIPWLFAKKNILLFQFPVTWVSDSSITNSLKFRRVHKVICNSYFVKKYIDKFFHVNSYVLAPPVTMIRMSSRKENIILTVGRFTQGMNMKKQEELIDIFISLIRSGLKNWKYVLVGSALESDLGFVASLREKAAGFPIEIYANVPRKTVVSYYQKAKIYWHGAGYAEDLVRHPERAEHFGIATAEAMSAGCVPIVFNGGGQKEIVEEGQNGFLWNTSEELRDKTTQMIKNKKLFKRIALQAHKTSQLFSEKHFVTSVRKLIL